MKNIINNIDKIELDEINNLIQIMKDIGMGEYIDPSWKKEPVQTNNHFIWLAVDSNGNEKMTSCESGFQRFSPKLYHSSKSLNEEIRDAAFKERKKICSYDDTQMKDDHWVEIPNKEDLGKFGVYPKWSYLPKGTIKKLIGKELTWEDEPIKYEG